MDTVKSTTLANLMEKIIDNSIEVVDLTHVLNEDTPVISLTDPFVDTKGFEIEQISKYDDNGLSFIGITFQWENIVERILMPQFTGFQERIISQ